MVDIRRLMVQLGTTQVVNNRKPSHDGFTDFRMNSSKVGKQGSCEQCVAVVKLIVM